MQKIKQFVRAAGLSMLRALGTTIVDWNIANAAGASVASGTNVFRLDADGRITDVVGVWGFTARP